MSLKLILYASLIVLISLAPLKAKNIRLNPRIINGEFSKPNQFPYMVSLRQFNETFEEGNYKHFCGAALISDRWVISGAHSFYGKRLNVSNIRIVVGAYAFSQDGDVYKVMKIIRHEHFDGYLKQNDISLIRSEIQITFKENVRPIAISKDWIEPNQIAIFSGYGITGNF